MSVVAGAGIITPALTLLQVVTQGETPATGELSDGVLYLNALLANWNSDELTTPVQSVSGTWQANTQGDFLGTGSIAFASYTGPTPLRLIDAFVTPNGRDIRMPVQNMEFYRAIGNKGATSSTGPEILAYDTGIGDSVLAGQVYVYPVPTSNTSMRVVFRYPFPLATNSSSTLILSAAAVHAAICNLAANIGPAYGATVSPEIKKEAADSLARLRNFNASAYNQNPNPPQGQTLPPPAQPAP